jgi:predicted transcriptional regulator
MAILKEVELHHEVDGRNANLPQEALSVLKVLDSLEDFTISIRKKITEEIRSTSKLIHVKLDSV